MQIDKLEAEIESMSKIKKKTASDQKHSDELRSLTERHKFHIDRMEVGSPPPLFLLHVMNLCVSVYLCRLTLQLLIRLMDNYTIAYDAINGVREDVEFYITDCQVHSYLCICRFLCFVFVIFDIERECDLLFAYTCVLVLVYMSDR